MVHYTDVEYLKLDFFQKVSYKISLFLHAIPLWFARLFKSILNFFVNFGVKVKTEAIDVWVTLLEGDWKTRVSFLIMGFGSIARGQVLRGLLFLTMELAFIFYMIFAGGYYLSKMVTLGDTVTIMNKATGTKIPGDNSFKILLYVLITFIFMFALLWTWRLNVKQNKIAQDILRDGKRLRSNKEDLQSLLDDQFHKSMLALPLAGIFMFTVLPILFMILVAFTNYGASHDPASDQLFTWVGWENFDLLLHAGSDGEQSFSAAFGEVLAWTFIWAFFATFLNYILGIFVAMMINKKGIKFKKFWRGVLVLTIAVPQFVSLLYISNTLAQNGFVVATLIKMGIVEQGFKFVDISNPTLARVLVIVINVWIGIPYLMLIATGVLMNVPADLYESAKIDGAGPVKQFTKITLPYLLFVTGPYLLTSFTGNLNNFNVIFLLTGGGPANMKSVSLQMSDGTSITSSVGGTDLLITWLYNLSMNSNGQPYYNVAAVISIMIFLVVSVISLIVYNLLPSNRGEEDFQ